MATRSSSAKKNGALDPALPQKKRARRRLVGAGALCLLAAIVLPIVFDSEPRQVRGDVQVRIPARDTPLTEQSDAAPQPPIPSGGPSAVSEPVRDDGSSRSRPSVPSIEEDKGVARSDLRPDAKVAGSKDAPPTATPTPRTEPKPRLEPDPKPEARSDTLGKLVDGKTQALKSGAYVLQAGAFATEKAATDQAERLASAGVEAYVEKIKANGRDRVRVRAGPFPNKDAAERARAKLKSAGIDAALISP